MTTAALIALLNPRKGSPVIVGFCAVPRWISGSLFAAQTKLDQQAGITNEDRFMVEHFEDYLFEYPYQGSHWAFTIKAASQEDAQARFRALGWAQFKGGPCETISAVSPRGWIVPLIVWWRNQRRRPA